MRKRGDNTLNLDKGGASTLGHTGEFLDCSRTSVYDLVRAGLLELVYLDAENRRLPRITNCSILRLIQKSEVQPPGAAA